jgi:hypothetical protein
MVVSLSLLTVVYLLGVEPQTPPEQSAAEIQAQWLPVFERTAHEYRLVPTNSAEVLKLLDRPVYKWARSGPHGGTNGGVFVWINRGCAEAVGCFWRYPASDGKVSIAHELHSLSPEVLTSEREGPHSWKPKSGLPRQLLADAAPPAATPTARLKQMRAICRDFAARSVSGNGERTELRLLPQPLYRYQSTNPDLTDGALFAFVCTVGTDPEVFLQVESIETAQGPRWHYALARFSHLNLFVDYQGREVWQSVRDEKDTIAHSADNKYWLFHEPIDEKQIERKSTE